MSPPSSELFRVQDIPGAGRGAVASQQIANGTLILRTKPPVAHVIFREYRKEVCAECFHYDRGRTLPVRLHAVGKVFCTSECQTQWLEEQGEFGVDTWMRLQQFLQLKSITITNAAGLPLLAPKPSIEEVRSSWQRAEEVVERIREKRSKQETGFTQFSQRPWCRTVDPDILGYLLSGVIFHHRYPETWSSAVLALAMDDIPYRTVIDLEAHCNSFLQLATILPMELLSTATSQICQILIRAASHNSFGIRSGSEDGEEYMGYGLHPEASYFNHSCRPNVGKKRVGNAWEFRALREIDAGEECCITYLGGDEEELTVGRRRQRLREVWGFECMCIRCTQENSS